jgi:hypothetical protein
MIDPLSNPVGALATLLHELLLTLMPSWLAAMLMALIGAGLLAGIVSGAVILLVWMERKIIARMQDRSGPNRVGPFGLLQTVADAIKLLSKEDIVPARVDKILWALSPIVVLAAALMAWAVIPWSPGVVPSDLNVGVLFVAAMGSLPVIGVIMAGWGCARLHSWSATRSPASWPRWCRSCWPAPCRCRVSSRRKSTRPDSGAFTTGGSSSRPGGSWPSSSS